MVAPSLNDGVVWVSMKNNVWGNDWDLKLWQRWYNTRINNNLFWRGYITSYLSLHQYIKQPAESFLYIDIKGLVSSFKDHQHLFLTYHSVQGCKENYEGRWRNFLTFLDMSQILGQYIHWSGTMEALKCFLLSFKMSILLKSGLLRKIWGDAKKQIEKEKW